MKKHTVGMTALLLLTFGSILAGCDLNIGGSEGGSGGGGGSAFVAVTGINDVPTAALAGDQLSLGGTAAPANATNKTIVWSGSGVSNGTLNAAAAGNYEVTATIANGKSSSTPYTQQFTITVYNAGTSATNPFGGDASPSIWVLDGTQSQVYATVKDSTWEATADVALYNSGTYSHIAGTKAARWTVATGASTGDTGLALIRDEGKMLVANFTSDYSSMNGTYTKLDGGLTMEGTWQSDMLLPPYDGYVKVVADSSDGFVISRNDCSTWEEKVKGTYTTTPPTNPSTWTITHVKVSSNWEPWNNLTDSQKAENGGTDTYTAFIYADRCEIGGYLVLYKQP